MMITRKQFIEDTLAVPFVLGFDIANTGFKGAFIRFLALALVEIIPQETLHSILVERPDQSF